jgi:hypothetical protein
MEPSSATVIGSRLATLIKARMAARGLCEIRAIPQRAKPEFMRCQT